jgi:hypothetical protein
MALSVGSFSQVAQSLTDNFWEPYLMAISETPLDGLVVAAFPTIFVSATIGGLQGVAMKLDGAGGITVGAHKRIDDCSDNRADVSIDISGLKTDGTMCGVYFYDDDPTDQGRTISVNTSTLALTVNAAHEVPTDGDNNDFHAVDRIDDTHLFIGHHKFVAGGGRLNCYKLTESGGTLSSSSALTLDSDTETGTRVFCCVLSTSRAFVFWETDTDDVQVALVDISGANPTLVDGPDIIEGSAQIGNTGANSPKAVAVSSTVAVIGYETGSGANVKMVAVENSSDTIVIGTAITLSGASTAAGVTIGRQSETRVIVTHAIAGPAIKVENITIDGTDLTQEGNDVTLTPPSANFDNGIIALAQISGSTVSWIVMCSDTNDALWAAEVQDEIPVEATPKSRRGVFARTPTRFQFYRNRRYAY